MSITRVADLLQQSYELCGEALDGETDPQFVEGLNFVREQLAAAIALLDEREEPAIRFKQQ